LEEALERARSFSELGADILFVEAPQSVEEMQTICREVEGNHMANIIDGGKTPVLSPSELHTIGFKLAAYPLVLVSAAMQAMATALKDLQAEESPQGLMPFTEVREIVGFDDYYEEEKNYGASRR
jgi:2-methylisocitrate lyase-like PEP mutase family enzyme